MGANREEETDFLSRQVVQENRMRLLFFCSTAVGAGAWCSGDEANPVVLELEGVGIAELAVLVSVAAVAVVAPRTVRFSMIRLEAI